MKILIFSCMMICFVSIGQAQSYDLDLIRKDFNKGVKDSDLCEKYYKLLKSNAKSELEKGYEAAFQMFMAKHTGNPIKKLSYFNGGKRKLESQIKKSPDNIELRFIRLCIQYYVPSYLGYNNNVDGDKYFLVHNLYKIEDKEVRVLLFDYLKGTKMYNDDELALLGR